jgi:Putative beta-barrel porin 2
VLYGLGFPVHAQTSDGPDPALVRVRVGPLWMNPSIALTNIGVDQNVFNDPPDKGPKQDFTATITPTTDLWLRVGGTWITSRVSEQIAWFQEYASERSASTSYAIGWKLPLSRMFVKLDGAYAGLRDRPGFEIDTRAERNETSASAAVEVLAFSKTYLGIAARRTRTDFDANQQYLGVDLQQQLNRTGTSVAATLRHQLTPLTTLSFNVSRDADRFELEPLRDSDATNAVASVQFDRFALVKGSASFGYSDFRPRDPSVPAYTGATAQVNLSYTLLDMTRFAVTADRSVQYSYDVEQPYYLQTGYGASVAQQLFGPLDVVARGAMSNLAYRDRAGADVEVPGRVDHVRTFGASLGYHLGRDLRLAFNADKAFRRSPIADRQYDGWKFGSSLVYGF